MTEQTPKPWVLMAGNAVDFYADGWWEPAGAYIDEAEARAALDEMKRRIPELNVSLREVPLGRRLHPTASGRLWEIRFEFDDDGSWQWSSFPYPLAGDELQDRTGEPYDPYDLVATGVDDDRVTVHRRTRSAPSSWCDLSPNRPARNRDSRRRGHSDRPAEHAG